MTPQGEIKVPIYGLDESRIKGVLEAFADAGCCRRLTRTPAGSESVPRCHVGPMGLFVVGQYLWTWGCSPYWDIILRGGVAGYSLCLHELTEIEWYFENYNTRRLDPYDKTPKKQPSGGCWIDQIEGYREAHAWALLVEHRYIQLRAREEGEDFKLRELVEANPHAWGINDQDWETLEGVYGSRIADVDKKTSPAGLERARRWFDRHNYSRPG